MPGQAERIIGKVGPFRRKGLLRIGKSMPQGSLSPGGLPPDGLGSSGILVANSC